MATPKEIVRQFYNSDFANDANICNNFFHPDVTLYWSSSQGFRKLNFKRIVTHLNNILNAYLTVKIQISHLLASGNFVTIRYTVYVSIIENPDEEVPLAHYMTIWEVKEGKLFKGYEISLLADESASSLESYKEIKL